MIFVVLTKHYRLMKGGGFYCMIILWWLIHQRQSISVVVILQRLHWDLTLPIYGRVFFGAGSCYKDMLNGEWVEMLQFTLVIVCHILIPYDPFHILSLPTISTVDSLIFYGNCWNIDLLQQRFLDINFQKIWDCVLWHFDGNVFFSRQISI